MVSYQAHNLGYYSYSNSYSYIGTYSKTQPVMKYIFVIRIRDSESEEYSSCNLIFSSQQNVTSNCTATEYQVFSQTSLMTAQVLLGILHHVQPLQEHRV